MPTRTAPALPLLAALIAAAAARGGDTPADRVARLDPVVTPADERAAVAGAVAADVRRRMRAANDQSTAGWRTVRTRADWEAFRRPRLDALRASLGTFPEPAPPRVKVTGRHAGDGFRVENLVFESRPGLWVTANLYRPERPRGPMPGLLISHAHHTPKEHGELQDMGMTWARAGCLVLVPDHLGHGERRQHPFTDASAYPKPFRVGRQDYYFRYDNGVRLHLAGDGLIGWMVWDLLRGVDVLLAQEGIDPKRVILLGAVAGGGDPAAVAAALDDRIAAAVPFNFGGPQPETRYPLPEDAEAAFNYAGGGSWESTRNLRRSAADGFMPWVIVGGVAPRRLVYAHEFAWDRDRDPVWRRLQAIYKLYDAPDRLAFTLGRGSVTGQPPEATHCTHIGPPHRKLIHDAFRQWFGIEATEYSHRLPAADLRCLTPEAAKELKPRSLTELAGELADARMKEARARREGKPAAERLRRLRAEWDRVLGGTAAGEPKARPIGKEPVGDGITAERVLLTTEPGITVPVLLLTPRRADGKKPPVVVVVSQAGKAALLKQRAADIAELLAGGAAVCLPDVRGTGEGAIPGGRGRNGAATAYSSSLLMLGDTLVGGQLRDLRGVLAWLRAHDGVDGARPALWGESLARVNPPDVNLTVPRDDDAALPPQAEPLGGLLALFAALYEDGVRAAYVRGGLVGYRSVLDHHLVLIPHDAVLPGALATGDLSDMAAALAPRSLAVAGLVDGANRRVPERVVQEAYRGAEVADADHSPAGWLLARLR